MRVCHQGSMNNFLRVDGCQAAVACRYTEGQIEDIGKTVLAYQTEFNSRFCMKPRLFDVNYISFVIPEADAKHENFEMVTYPSLNPLGRTGRNILIPLGVIDPEIVMIEMDGWATHELGHIFMNEPRLIDPLIPGHDREKGLSFINLMRASLDEGGSGHNLPLLRRFFDPKGLEHPFLKGLKLNLDYFVDASGHELAGVPDFIKDYDELASVEDAKTLSQRLRDANGSSTGSASSVARNAIEMIADRIAFLTAKEPISWRHTVNRRADKYINLSETGEVKFSVPFVGIFAATVEKARGPRGSDIIEPFSSDWTPAQRRACYWFREIFMDFWDGIELKG